MVKWKRKIKDQKKESINSHRPHSHFLIPTPSVSDPLQKTKMHFSTKLLTLTSLLAVITLTLASQDVDLESGELMKKEQESTVSDALQYLDQLDKYYSLVSRPR